MFDNVIFSADWHIYNHKSRKIPEILDCIYQLCDYAVENKVETLIFGGDLLERKYYTADVFEPIAELLKKLSSVFKRIIVVEGNHEMVAGGNSLLRPWELLPNIVVVTDYEFIDGVAFAPYPIYNKTLTKYLKQAVADKAKAFVSHFPLTDSVVKGGHKLSGFSIPRDVAKKFKLILLGDIHEFQKIKPNIYYPGSITQLDFGETPSKGFIHVRGWKVNFIPTSFQELRDIHVSTVSQLKEIQKDLDPSKVRIHTSNKLLEPELKGLIYVVEEDVEDNRVRLQITKDTKHNEIIDKYVDYLLEHDKELNLNPDAVKSVGHKYISKIVGEKTNLHTPRRVDIGYVSIANFRSISALELYTFGKKGLVLVDGENQVSTFSDSNGAGKSSLYEAIIWGLFGVSVNGTVLAQLVKDGQSYMGVELHFKVQGHNETYRVRRSWSNGKSDLQLSIVGENEIEKNISGLRIAETQDKIFELTGLDYNMFINSVFFSSELIMPFVNYGDSERKKMITNALDTTPYLEAQKLVKADQIKLTESMAKLKSAISETQVEITEKVKHIEYVKRRRGELKTKKRELESFLIKSKNEILELDDKIKEFEETKSQLTELTSQASRYSDEIYELEQKIRLLKKGIQSEKSIMATQEKTANSYQKQLNELSYDVCNCCGQKVKTKAAVAQLEARQYHLETKLSEHKRLLSDSKNQIKSAKKKVKKLEAKIAELIKKRDEILKKAEEFDFDHTEYSEYQNRKNYLRAKISVSEKDLKSVKVELSEKIEHVSGLEKTVERLRNQIKSKSEKIDQIQELALPIIRFWIDGFGKTGIVSFLLDPIANTLNASVAEYNRRLTDDQIKLRFVTQVQLQSGRLKDSFTVEVENTQGGASRKSSSQGEKRRIDLCTIWSIRDLFEQQGFSINMEFYDEVLDSLDYEGIQRVLSLLKEQAYKKEKLVFLSSHDANVLSLGLDFLDYRATMVKTKGGSILKWT